MRDSITVTKAQLEALVMLSESQWPSEAVALLLGKKCRIVQVEPMRNADSSRVSFSIDPTELIKSYLEAEKKGLEVTGIFHSHPGEPDPSPKDLEYMELNPMVWIIYSNSSRQFRAHLFDGGLRSISIDIV